MSEQINKVLASTAQAFTTAEQKQARDNIAAQASGDYAFNSSLSAKQDTSAMSSYVPYSAISADANSAITSINGSSVGSFSGVSSNNNVTGDGTSGSPVGLSAQISLVTSSATSYFNGFGMEGTADPYTSCRYYIGGWNFYTNGDSTHHHEVGANASGINLTWNTNFYWSNIHASGILQKDAWSPSMHSAEWAYTGATLKDWTGVSAVFQPSGMTLYNSASGAGRTVSIDDIDRWNAMTAGTMNTNNGVTGNGSTSSPIGLSSRIEFPSSNSGAAVGHRGMLVSSNSNTAWYYGAFASFEAATASANYRASEAEFSNASGTAVVNKSSIDRWNSMGSETVTQFGDEYPIASANTVETGYNWVKRTVSATGLPALPMYGFGSLPSHESSIVGSGGQFFAYQPGYSAVYLSGAETEYYSSYLPTGVTWPMRVDVWNLSNHDVNITTDTFHGATSDFHHGDSATIWYIPALSRWSDMANI